MGKTNVDYPDAHWDRPNATFSVVSDTPYPVMLSPTEAQHLRATRRMADTRKLVQTSRERCVAARDFLK